MWGLNFQPQAQESHDLPTEPAKAPLVLSAILKACILPIF